MNKSNEFLHVTALSTPAPSFVCESCSGEAIGSVPPAPSEQLSRAVREGARGTVRTLRRKHAAGREEDPEALEVRMGEAAPG